MNSVERIKHYGDLPMEGEAVCANDPPMNEWPLHGQITFQDVQLQYRPGLPMVLKGLSFSIASNSRIGIIGRTGAGKSSIVQALYRTVELAAGHISIDGIDLSTLGLHTVCSLVIIC